MMKNAKLIALDFDGVLHSYSTPWSDAGTISDGPVPGAMQFLGRLVDDDRFQVAVVSSRMSSKDGRDAMNTWLDRHLEAEFGEVEGFRIGGEITLLATRPPAFVTIDDRAITFNGEWPDLDELAEFKPWNKQPEAHVRKANDKLIAFASSGFDRAAVEKMFAGYIGIERNNAQPRRISIGWYVPLRDGGEVLIPEVAFYGCGSDLLRIREILEAFSCAYHEGKRGTGDRYMTETCGECGQFTGDRRWEQFHCVSHARRQEAILSGQGSLNASESEALAEVRAFLEGQPS